jgi:hypothetical protein
MTSARQIKLRRKGWLTNAGPRCRIYSPGCPSCEEYRRLIEQGRFSYNLDEFWEYALQHDPDGPNISWTELEALHANNSTS